jgi:tryptophan-rich sensory protein
MKKCSILEALGSVAIAQLAGLIGSASTISSRDTWYKDLEKPSFNPPAEVFAPVWTTLYTLMGTAAYLVYKEGWEKKEVKKALNAYFTQLVFNSLWSILFFGFKSTSLSLIDLILIWGFTLITINLFYRVSRTSAILLIPYILWLSFALILNFEIWRLNK